MAPRKEFSALISMTGFKGSLSNLEACETVASALNDRGIRGQLLPLGDGGSGTMRTIQAGVGGELVSFPVSNPLGRKVQASVLCLPSRDKVESVYLESSEACGHALIPEGQRDAMRSSSYGLGQLMAQSLECWPSIEKMYIGLGDSATSDMGMGMLCGLGFEFLDAGGKTLWGTAEGLRSIRTIRIPERSRWSRVKITVLCDVMNPLCGRDGSARTFSRQKGATDGQIKLIEQGMENFAQHIQPLTGRSLQSEPMTGSAGGISAACLGLLNAELVHGAPFVMDWIHFDRVIAESSCLITGEGRTDYQTLSGKAPHVCLERARLYGKPSFVISGALGEGIEAVQKHFPETAFFACGNTPSAREALYKKAFEVFAPESRVDSGAKLPEPRLLS